MAVSLQKSRSFHEAIKQCFENLPCVQNKRKKQVNNTKNKQIDEMKKKTIGDERKIIKNEIDAVIESIRMR